MQIKKSIKQYPYEWLSISVLLVYFYPIIFVPNQARFLIHDNLDGMVPLLKFTGNSDVYLKSWDASIPGIMNGIPRACLASWSFFSFLFFIFNPLFAYVIHYLFQHIIAFIGMRLLIKSNLSKNSLIYNGVALAFALLPFWPGGELTVAGLPLLLFACLQFLDHKNRLHLIIIVLFPFFSSLAIGNLFSFPLLFLSLILIKLKRLNMQTWLKIFLIGLFLFLSSIASEYQLLQYLFSGDETNRLVAQEKGTSLNWKGLIGVSVLSFLFGHYHFHSLHIAITILLIVFIIYELIKKNIRVLIRENKLVLMVSLFVLFLSIFTTLYNNSALFKGMPRVNLRLWVLWPILWYVVFALILERIKKNYIRMILVSFQIIWVLFLIYPKDYFGSKDADNVFAQTWVIKDDKEAQSFNSYYKIQLFDTLKNKVPDLVKHNTISLGFVPGIALFNDLKVYDTYLSIYPLEKWKSWQKINQEELHKSEISNNFTNKAYLISHELTKGNKKISYPDWDFAELSKNKVKYILTYDVQIEGIEFVEKVSNLYLYKL